MMTDDETNRHVAKKGEEKDDDDDGDVDMKMSGTDDDGTTIRLPEGNLTVDRINEFVSLSDRQKICWALQTETHVRLGKVKDRDSYHVSTRLNDGNYLFDLYPNVNQQKHDDDIGNRNNNDERNDGENEDDDNKIDDNDIDEKNDNDPNVVVAAAAAADDDDAPKSSSTTTTATATATATVRNKRVLALERARQAYQRKSRHYLRQSTIPDNSWNAVTPISITTKQKRYPAALQRPPNYNEGEEEDDDDIEETNYTSTGKGNNIQKNSNKWELHPAPVPPNLLYFQIILEGYMGYQWFSYCPKSSELPRSAVMGGAILAVLTAWTDPYIVEQFEIADLPTILFYGRENEQGHRGNQLPKNSSDDDDENGNILPAYQAAKKDLVEMINEYFLYRIKKPEKSLPFSDGDVDIFLQASPLTRRVMCHMSDMGLNSSLISQIGEYIGGLSFVQDDLRRASKQFAKSCISDRADGYLSGCVYALANNGLSCEVAIHRDEAEEEHIIYWPRTTQLIQLRPQADLLGALMDFDLSCVACAYDGQDVLLTPRAAFSLKTKTLIVTPFLLKEERNSRRVEKYWKRGFDAFLVDPFCLHKRQCEPQSAMFSYAENEKKQDKSKFYVLGDRLSREARSSVGWVYDPKDLRFSPRQLIKVYDTTVSRKSRASQAERNAVYEMQSDGWATCCCREEHRNQSGSYSFILVEHTEGEAMEYYGKRWSPEWRSHVEGLHPYLLMSCEECHFEYEMYKARAASLRSGVLDSPEVDGPSDNFLHDGVSAYAWRPTTKSAHLAYNFYCGASFDSRRAADKDYHLGHACGNFLSRERMEQIRYIAKNGGSDVGYKPCFVYAMDINGVFHQASSLLFPVPTKAPVGLNPERFVAECKYCMKWLGNCEFSVTACEDCPPLTASPFFRCCWW